MKNFIISLLFTIIILLVAPFEGVTTGGRLAWAVMNVILIYALIHGLDHVNVAR